MCRFKRKEAKVFRKARQEESEASRWISFQHNQNQKKLGVALCRFKRKEAKVFRKERQEESESSRCNSFQRNQNQKCSV